VGAQMVFGAGSRFAARSEWSGIGKRQGPQTGWN
jgi:hypothetical protein